MPRGNSVFPGPVLCYVTDRRALRDSSLSALTGKLRQIVPSGVDLVQIREKDLSGRAAAELLRIALALAGPPGGAPRILVNDRLDVALAEQAGGVHLGEDSLAVAAARRLAPDGFLVGASVHSLERARIAAAEGADYLIFGPVFRTPGKAGFGEPQGLAKLSAVCRAVSVPVLAIGGITLENAPGCSDAGAAGIAAIRLFQDAEDPEATAGELRSRLQHKQAGK